MVISVNHYIWDTGALSLFFADHKETVDLMKEIKQGNAKGIVPSLILSEFYYKTWQKFGKQAAQVRTISLRENLLEVIELKEGDVFEIGEFKVKNNGLSLADCVLLTIAKRTKSVIITTDTPLHSVSRVKTKKMEY